MLHPGGVHKQLVWSGDLKMTHCMLRASVLLCLAIALSLLGVPPADIPSADAEHVETITEAFVPRLSA